MPGTGIVYGLTLAMPCLVLACYLRTHLLRDASTDAAQGTVCLRVCYEMSGTDAAHGATRWR
eukprot:880897-Rhodomonas_salina.2